MNQSHSVVRAKPNLVGVPSDATRRSPARPCAPPRAPKTPQAGPPACACTHSHMVRHLLAGCWRLPAAVVRPSSGRVLVAFGRRPEASGQVPM